MRAPGSELPGWLRVLYRLVLRAYPSALRARHGDEMTDLVAHRWRRLQGRRWARSRILGYLGRDLGRMLRSRLHPAAALVSVLHDVRFGWRGMRRTPVFTATAVLTLALGIGANTAIFSVVSAVLLDPLPYPDAERIQLLRPGSWHAARQVDALRERVTTFAGIAGVGQATFILRVHEPERVYGSVAWPGYFATFGIEPALGRGLREEDTVPGAEPVALLSDRLWRERFGADPEVLGRSVALEGEGRGTYTVVGVLPPGHDPFPWPTQVLVPARLDTASPAYKDNHRYWILGRLTSAASDEEGAAELRAVVERLASQPEAVFSRDDAGRTEIASLHESRVGGAGSSLLVLLGAVGVVLLIGCVNIANLLLARSSARRGEVAVRAALGAGRARIVRQLLTESVLLALIGGAAGVVLALVGVEPLAATLPTAIPRQAQVRVDAEVLGFALAVSVLAGVAFGLVPALRTGRRDAGALHGLRGARGDRGRSRLHAVLLAGEVGLAVILLVAAGLLSKSLWSLYRIDPGFDPVDVVAFQLAPSAERYADAEARAGYYQRVIERLQAVPGVVAAGAISNLPVSSGLMGVGISPDGDPVPEGDDPTICSYRAVTPGAFTALGMRLLEGRLLTAADGSADAPVGVINRRLATLLWPDEAALGRQVAWGTGDPWFTVVGVVEDVHQGSLAERPDPEAYVSYAQQGTWLTALHVVVRHRPGAEVLAAARAAVWEIDADVPVTNQGSLAEQVRDSMAGERGWAIVFGSFALLALVLAGVGVSGVTSYLAAQRRHEVGVRMALGAQRAHVVAAVLRIGLVPVAAGMVVGVGVSLLGGRLVEGLLYGVEAVEPAVLLGVVGFLTLVALVANAVPALRASRIDPVRALRAA